VLPFMQVTTQFTKARHPVTLPDLSVAESAAQAHHTSPHRHSMQPSHPGFPVFGLGGTLPPLCTGQIGEAVGVVGQPASGGNQQRLFVVA
jgi:hypothetical protein